MSAWAPFMSHVALLRAVWGSMYPNALAWGVVVSVRVVVEHLRTLLD